MEKIAASIIVAFAAFCVVWAFIKQLRSDEDGGPCGGKCSGCPSSKKNESQEQGCEGPKV